MTYSNRDYAEDALDDERFAEIDPDDDLSRSIWLLSSALRVNVLHPAPSLLSLSVSFSR